MRFIKDPHGNVVATSKNGQIANTYEYTAFGNQRINDSTINNPFRYCGEYYDEESGNIYLKARYYSSSVGRFISEDPIRDGLNWYVYCGNNPIMFVDPSGLADVPENGILACTELIAACNELIDCITNQINEGVTDKLLEDEVRIKQDKIKLNQLLWYSDELNNLVNEVIVNNDNVTVQQISCIIKITYDMQRKIVDDNLVIGEEIIPESEIWERYYSGRQTGTVYLAASRYYPIEGDSLAVKILSGGYYMRTLAVYGGFNGEGIYQDVAILERVKIYEDNAGVSDEYPHEKYQGNYRGQY